MASCKVGSGINRIMNKRSPAAECHEVLAEPCPREPVGRSTSNRLS